LGRKLLQEDAGPMLPVSTYGASKLAGEALLSAYCNMFGIQAWVFRFGQRGGPTADARCVADFLRKLKVNPRQLAILGDGNQSKPYIHVHDVLEGVWLAWGKSQERFNISIWRLTMPLQCGKLRPLPCKLPARPCDCEYSGGERGWKGDVPSSGWTAQRSKLLGWSSRRSSYQALEAAAQALVQALGNVPCKL